MNDPAKIRSALESARTIAVVGCSPNPDRPSNAIAVYLMEQGYRVIPVNPGHSRILGETCYRSLQEVPADVDIDIVDVFRRSDHVAPVALQAIARGTRLFFMQLGVVDEQSARLLEEAGIPVAMDRCILVEHASRGIASRNFGVRQTR
jgi:hypothetical protein